MRTYFPVLSIAGSDSSGGAGIQADIKTISATGCYAMTVITAVTAQNTVGVEAVATVEPEMVSAQIDAVYADIQPLAVKIGMLANGAVASAVADALEKYKPAVLIVDPVMVSTSGSVLLEQDAVDIITSRIFPIATLVTPNVMEARSLTGETDPLRQGEALLAAGCKAVLIKGGDSESDLEHKTDLLFMPHRDVITLRADAVHTRNTHGTGCTLSSAIASYMALGYGLEDAVSQGKLYVTRALEAGAFVTTGRGHGPVNHFFSPRRLKNFNPRVNNFKR